MENKIKIIKKKTWQPWFDDVASGKKKYDLRLNDFEINEQTRLIISANTILFSIVLLLQPLGSAIMLIFLIVISILLFLSLIFLNRRNNNN